MNNIFINEFKENDIICNKNNKKYLENIHIHISWTIMYAQEWFIYLSDPCNVVISTMQLTHVYKNPFTYFISTIPTLQDIKYLLYKSTPLSQLRCWLPIANICIEYISPYTLYCAFHCKQLYSAIILLLYIRNLENIEYSNTSSCWIPSINLGEPIGLNPLFQIPLFNITNPLISKAL